MKKTITLFLVICMSTQFMGCIGYSIKSKSTPYKKFRYKKQNSPQKGWQDLVIYDQLDPNDKVQKIAKIKVTGNESASEFELLKKLRKEAGRYYADAILHVETREVERSSYNGIPLTLGLLSIFISPENPIDFGSGEGGYYYTLEVEGIAIKFIED